MTGGSIRLNRKETFSVSMVLFIGLFYVLSLVSALFQTQSIPVNKLFGITEGTFLLLSLIYCSGAIFFFRKKNIGWIICAATLLNFVVVVFKGVINVSQSPRFDAYAAMVISFFLLLLMALVFLFNKNTRLKFAVSNKSYLLTIAVYIMLLLITFLL
ncbi:MAG: hypothetical protein ABIN89_18375 [Chitinophagaceae bacterium]